METLRVTHNHGNMVLCLVLFSSSKIIVLSVSCVSLYFSCVSESGTDINL